MGRILDARFSPPARFVERKSSMTSPTSPRSRGGDRWKAGAIVSAGMGVLAVALAACGSSPSTPASVERVPGGPTGHYDVATGIHKIKHVIVIEQENRSFDNYFGTYPGADGIPMQNGEPTVCVPMPAGGCQKPYHDPADVNGGGPHGERHATLDVNGGKMDGFIKEASGAKKGCGVNVDNPACAHTSTPDVMGY